MKAIMECATYFFLSGVKKVKDFVSGIYVTKENWSKILDTTIVKYVQKSARIRVCDMYWNDLDMIFIILEARIAYIPHILFK